jgi:hypothetical protein
VLLRPEDEPAEGAAFLPPAVRNDFHALVVADEDAILLRRGRKPTATTGGTQPKTPGVFVT